MKKVAPILVFTISLLLATLVIIFTIKGFGTFANTSPAMVAIPRVVPTELPAFTHPNLQRGMAAAGRCHPESCVKRTATKR
jgi:hypothetical protein